MFEIEWEIYLSFWLIEDCFRVFWIQYNCWYIDIMNRFCTLSHGDS